MFVVVQDSVTDSWIDTVQKETRVLTIIEDVNFEEFSFELDRTHQNTFVKCDHFQTILLKKIINKQKDN